MKGQATVTGAKHHVVLQEGRREKKKQKSNELRHCQSIHSVHLLNLSSASPTQINPKNTIVAAKSSRSCAGTPKRIRANTTLIMWRTCGEVAVYCKRHWAQETAKQDTGSNSYKSLKNRGHDVLKAK